MSDRPLHPDDAILTDYLMGQCDPVQREQIARRLDEDGEFAKRAEKLGGLLKVLDAAEAPEVSELVIARTVEAVSAAARTEALLAREAVVSRPVSRPTFSFKELGAMAALLFIAATILLPSFQRARQLAVDQACQAQAGQIGVALGQYANANKGELPAMGRTDAAWLVDADGSPVSNSRNLWRLVQDKIAHPQSFQCPAVRKPEFPNVAQMTMLADFPSREFIDYSYHNGVNVGPVRISGEHLGRAAAEMAILADRTPVFPDGRFDPRCLNQSNSPNHGGRGQVVLYLDGHGAWTDHAEVGVDRDNIWLVQGVSHYRGIERPVNATDTFLLPNFLAPQP